MRKAKLTICFQVLILMLLSLNICYGWESIIAEGGGVQTWDEIRWRAVSINLKTAQKISQVDSFIEQYNNEPNNVEKDKILHSHPIGNQL